MDMHITPEDQATADRIAPISRQIWDAKYRLKTADGTPVDLSIEDSWRRVAKALATSVAIEGVRGKRRWNASMSARW